MEDFVTRSGAGLVCAGAPYRIAGANNYYLGFVAEPVQRRVLELAAGFGFNVLRIWAFQDGSFDLTRLDRAIALCAERGIRVILTLTNHWKDFGGLPRVAEQLGLAEGQVYTDERSRDAWRAWAATLVERVNPITGRRYVEEPAILAWELANEPRGEHVAEWAAALAGWLRATGVRQLIAVGDEDALDVPGADLLTAHCYRCGWIGRRSIRRWLERAEAAGKPLLLEEFGAKTNRNRIYRAWLSTVATRGGAGWLVWMVGVEQGDEQPYRLDDYVVRTVAECPALVEQARRLIGG